MINALNTIACVIGYIVIACFILGAVGAIDFSLTVGPTESDHRNQ